MDEFHLFSFVIKAHQTCVSSDKSVGSSGGRDALSA